MSRISLYLDEDAMDLVLATALRNRGVDVRTVNEKQLEIAMRSNRY